MIKDLVQHHPSHDIDQLESYLSNRICGTYSRNWAIIRFARDDSYWFEKNEATIQRLAVFVHEYVHYLHNFSTIAGIYDFIAQLRLARCVMQSVGKDGRGQGIAVISPEAKMLYEGTLKWQRHIRGDQSVPFDMSQHGKEARLSYRTVDRVSSNVQVPNQDIPLYEAHVVLDISGGAFRPETGLVQLGSSIIMEGLAWEIERLLYLREIGSTNELDDRTPIVPYKLCRIIFESYTNTIPTSRTMAKACLLALQATDPGDSFFEIASAFNQRVNDNESDEQVLDRVVAISTGALRENLSKLVNQSFAPEFDAFSNRGPVSAGLRQLGEHCKRYIVLRAEDPFFELNLIDQGLERDDLLKLLREFPSCPIIHDEGFAPEEKSLFLISAAEPGADIVGELGAFQGFMQFVDQHIDKQHASLFDASMLKDVRCIFYGTCSTPLSENEAYVCQTRPWYSFSRYENRKEGCWYAHGVAAARARKDL